MGIVVTSARSAGGYPPSSSWSAVCAAGRGRHAPAVWTARRVWGVAVPDRAARFVATRWSQSAPTINAVAHQRSQPLPDFGEASSRVCRSWRNATKTAAAATRNAHAVAMEPMACSGKTGMSYKSTERYRRNDSRTPAPTQIHGHYQQQRALFPRVARCANTEHAPDLHMGTSVRRTRKCGTHFVEVPRPDRRCRAGPSGLLQCRRAACHAVVKPRAR